MENENIGNFSIPSSSTLDLTDSLRYTAADLVEAELREGYIERHDESSKRI